MHALNAYIHTHIMSQIHRECNKKLNITKCIYIYKYMNEYFLYMRERERLQALSKRALLYLLPLFLCFKYI